MKLTMGIAIFLVLGRGLLAQTEVTSQIVENDSSKDSLLAEDSKSERRERVLERHEERRKEYFITDEERSKRRRERFCRARAEGDDEQRIFHLQLSEAIKEGYYKEVKGLNGWMEQYAGEFLEQSSSFDFMEKTEYDFSSPELALRSYWHGLTKCDAVTILRHSDPSFIMYLESAKKWNLFIEPKKYLNDGMSKVVPLLKGSCVISGKKYILIFYRREFPVDPKLNKISFHWDFFVFMNGRYFLSDSPASSEFGNMASVMKLGTVYPLGKYPDLAEELKGTDVPPRFYEINE